MADTDEITGQQRDRSPAFPIIPVKVALERLAQFEAHFKRSAARAEKIGDAWGIGTKGYADRMAAALRYYGLLEYQGTGKERHIVVSELGRNYLRTQQEDVKRQLVADIALKPRQIAIFWNRWGSDRPADAAALDDLVQKNGFSLAGARDFLKVYDATIAFAKPQSGDKILSHQVIDEGEKEAPDNHVPEPKAKEIKVLAGERELTTGILSKDGAAFRLIISGTVGVKEIERLIKKLEFDKEILAESDAPERTHSSE